ncbi:MAG: hypothetical protein A3G34_09560 [Candidatus Lindowbacteria bacterium RIFCSPLOWO2_12_FULL_62_27]|nr:MAG: hypothetical protein A3G34_09560 [Candidatus Lindowbacteria bacterium RIFCSPLOWO2_12_FULL_62_27]OGH61497.1 MAG: hypothetical protein A3I06_02555 [Candidatus Lindowbacteria bacterium RIFCSPLOWO2_02_FULL_62_12]
MDWLLVNLASRSGRVQSQLDGVRSQFKAHGVEVAEKAASTMPELQDIALKAVQSGADRLWVLGGDGTLAAAATHLCYSPTVLCALPGGTANVFCREMAIPLDAPAAVPALLSGRLMTIDVGEVDGIKFLLMASVGLDAQAVRDVNVGLKQRVGPLAYVIEGVRKLFSFGSPRLTVTDEHDIEHHGYHVAVQNARLYGGSIEMAPKAKLDDGRFDVVLLKKPGRLAILRFLWAAAAGRHVRLPHVEYFRSHSVRIHSATELSLQADGDCLTKLPATVSILPRALKVQSARSQA